MSNTTKKQFIEWVKTQNPSKEKLERLEAMSEEEFKGMADLAGSIAAKLPEILSSFVSELQSMATEQETEEQVEELDQEDFDFLHSMLHLVDKDELTEMGKERWKSVHKKIVNKLD